MEELKVLELFGGIGAIRKAFERQNIPHKVVDYVEIDKYAVSSYNAMFNENFEPQDITTWNKDIDVDFIMHGSPCQDFSLAGKQAGGDLGSGTRSSLMYETIRIVGKLRPKYVMWENVKNLLSKNHKHNFDAYIETMNILGYNSYYQVLNAKDYGIPQNRERVYTISIRKDIDKGNFTFPEKEELKLRLKDMLEDNVDEKYYLSDDKVSKIECSNFMQEKKRKEYSDTILARDWKDPKCVRVGGIFDTEKSRHQAGSVYDKEGLSPTLDVMQGGGRQPSIIEEPKIETIENYMPSGHDASRIVDKNGLAPTVKENHGTITAITEEKLPGAYGRNFGSKGKIQDTEGECDTLQAAMGNGGGNVPVIKIKNATKQGYLEATEGDGIDISGRMEYHRGTVQKEKSQTITISGGNNVGVVVKDKTICLNSKGGRNGVEGLQPSRKDRIYDSEGIATTIATNDFYNPNYTEGLRIRKLTPKECWRLMGFDDEDFEKAEKVNSNTQLYKQAGNSIVVNVLEKILANLSTG